LAVAFFDDKLIFVCSYGCYDFLCSVNYKSYIFYKIHMDRQRPVKLLMLSLLLYTSLALPIIVIVVYNFCQFGYI
jgi:hypothetical protein